MEKKVALVHACMTEKHDVIITLLFYIILFQNFCANKKMEEALFINSKILSTTISSYFTTCKTLHCRVKRWYMILLTLIYVIRHKIVFGLQKCFIVAPSFFLLFWNMQYTLEYEYISRSISDLFVKFFEFFSNLQT